MNFWHDLRYGIRMLSKRKGITAATVVILGLGIGASSAILTLIHCVVLSPLPYRQPARLVRIYESLPQFGWLQFSFSWPDYLDFRDRNRSFEQVAAYVPSSFTLSLQNRPEIVRGAAVTSSFWPLLGISPVMGRGFLPSEDLDDLGAPVAILSDSVWRRLFLQDPTVVGRAINIGERSFTIVGVLPSGFHLHNDEELWIPLGRKAADNGRGNHGTTVFGRLKNGVMLSDASREATALAVQVAHQESGDSDLRDIVLVTFQDWLVGKEFRRALWLLAGAVGFLLLIAYFNVSNLLLARSAERYSEMAVRTALGANPRRLIQQLLVESSILALIGGLFGALVGTFCIDAVKAFGGARIPRLDQVQLDWTVLAATLLLALVCGVASGIVPALRAIRVNVEHELRMAGRGGSPGRGRDNLRNILVVSELTLSLVLCVGAGLLIRSYWLVSRQDLGLVPQHLTIARINIPQARYPNAAAVVAMLTQLQDRLRAIPGVQNAAFADFAPVQDGQVSSEVYVEGSAVSSSVAPSADYRDVSAGFLETLAIPLVQGRTFTAQDVIERRNVAVISREFARRYFFGKSPIGLQFHPGSPSDAAVTIIGVVGDAISSGVEGKTNPLMYFAGAHFTNFRSTSIVIRSNVQPSVAASELREAIRGLDSTLPISNVRQMEELVSLSLTPRKFNLFLLGGFAGLAIVLASVGIFGVLSYTVSQRRQEFGIRMALGAQAADVLRLTFGAAVRLVATGLALGILGAFALTRLMASMLYGIMPTDPLTYACVALIFAGVALAACWFPAWHASRLDPNLALKHE